jgi:penicillin-binding protein 2
MRKRIAIKNHLEEIRLISQRSITALVFMVVLVLILLLRLGYLQLSEHDLYTTLSKKNWLDLVPLEPTRGLIYDRQGVLLAENIPVFGLDVIPYQIPNFPKMLAEISKVIELSDTEIAQFQKQLKQHRRFDEIPLKLRLSETEVARFYENQYHFPGVIIKARLLRHYPLGGSFSHVIGYVGRINIDELNDIDPSNYSATNYIGKQGIEKFYEDELHGTVGYEQAENDASGEPVRVLNQIKPIPGKNLYLTLDSQLQIAAEQALAGHRGAVVIIQPKTGQILAMVSEPGFDPNIFIDGINNQDYKTLQLSPDRPLYNRALRGLYPLASTIKPFIALEGLDSGAITPDFSIYDPGWFKLKNSSHVFHDWRHHGHGIVNITRAITSSCDTFFWELSLKLGIQRIDNILNQFGFGSVTGIDLDDELAGNVASPAWKRKAKGASWYEGDTIISVIGQGFMQATPLQLAAGIAAIANHGVRYTPYLLLGEQEPGKAYVQQSPAMTDPVKLQNPAVWQTVIDAMQNVVTSPEGTGYRLRHAPYTVAAKTGTAQVYSRKQAANESDELNESTIPEKLRNHSLLIAFAPVDNPQIAVAVIVENSKLASTVARQVLDHYLLPKTPPVSTANVAIKTS